MFENNKLLWFIVIAAFGASVAMLGAYDLRRRMAKDEQRGPRPDAHKIVEELKQTDLDPFRAMMKRDGKQAADKKSNELVANAQNSKVPSLSEQLGIDRWLPTFSDDSQEKSKE